MSEPMAQAYMEGRKTMTRRLMKIQPPSPDCKITTMIDTTAREERKYRDWNQWSIIDGLNITKQSGYFRCPYGQPGGYLRLLSTWAVDKEYDSFKPLGLPRSVLMWNHFMEFPKPKGFGKNRPGRFMPTWMRPQMPRTRITGIGVERVQEITDEDIISEGLNRQTIEDLVAPYAGRFKIKPEHWIHSEKGNSEEQYSYCKKCAEKEIRRLSKKYPEDKFELDGGWNTEGDGRPYCETCHAPLANSYTNYACEMECEHFEECPIDFKNPDSAEAWYSVLASEGWDGDDDIHKKIRRISFQGLWDYIHGPGAWEKNEWVWKIEVERNKV
jgi:hypothetical protein